MIKKKMGYLSTVISLTFICFSLNACSSSKLAKDHPQGVWLGKLDVKQGTCPTDGLASLRIDKGIVLFSPDDGALILRGVYNKKIKPQYVTASVLKTDMDHKPYNMVFEAKPNNENMVGTYGTPDCRADITFYRPNHYGWSDAIAH